MTSDAVWLDPERRHDFVLLFDVTDGNPNGDPDAGNLPRVDPETMQGLVTDVCLKRKVRDWVDATHGSERGMAIYVRSGVALNSQHGKAYEALGLPPRKAKAGGEVIDRARAYMCENFYDIRMFGAVMATDVNCGQVRGPVQLTFARSVDPVVPMDISITRVTVTQVEDLQPSEPDKGKRTEMGRKALLPYALFRGHGFFNPLLAAATKVTSRDLAVFWQALQEMWDLDRSSARGLMALRGLYVFSHEGRFGCARAHELFERVRVVRCGAQTPRSFADYAVEVDDTHLPAGVMLTRLVG